MRVELLYTERARKDLASFNVVIRKWIILKLDELCISSSLSRQLKALSGSLKGLHRLRIGDYRAIVRKEKGGRLIVLIVLKIGHRKDIYE
ncbi:MAG: type II toxin-antitoxin system RelE/ParE family toxin [bacterium]